MSQPPPEVRPITVTPENPTTIASEPKKKKKRLEEKYPDIEFAERGGDAALAADLPAIVDIHGDVIKADWHTIRAKANEAEAYEHSLGLWQAMKIYKKVHSIVFAMFSIFLRGSEEHLI
jgi:hypothetical protein